MSRKKMRCIINIRINPFSSIFCKALLNTKRLIVIVTHELGDRFDCGQTGLRRRSMLIGSPCCSKSRCGEFKRKYCEQGKQFTEELQHLVIFRSDVALLGQYCEETQAIFSKYCPLAWLITYIYIHFSIYYALYCYSRKVLLRYSTLISKIGLRFSCN